MQISDQELRSLVRDAIARASVEPGHHATGSAVGAAFGAHASHVMLPLVRGADADGACLIEPTVRCNHCGYCVSYGH